MNDNSLIAVPNEYLNLNIEKICRICLCESNEMQSLFEEGLAECLKELACVNCDQNDGLPKVLCDTCALEVNKWFKFKLKILKSELILHSLTVERKIERENTITIEESKIDLLDLKTEPTNTTLEVEPLSDTTGCLKEISLERKSQPHVSLTETSNLTKHVKTDNKEKKHQCEECGSRFKKRHLLRDHLRTHTGEKPFCCKVCLRAFGQKNHLRQHMTVIHDNTVQYSSLFFLFCRRIQGKDAMFVIYAKNVFWEPVV